MRRRFERVSDQLGITQTLDIADLMYNDPDSTELTGWLDPAGWQAGRVGARGGRRAIGAWRAGGLAPRDEIRRLGRGVDVPMSDDDDALSSFVVAERL